MAQADAIASRRAARKLGDLITERSKQLAEIEVRDNGKLYAEMSMQTAYGAVVSLLRWPCRQDRRAVLPTDKPDTFNYTRYEPLGVIAAIVPWNSPLLLTTWKLAGTGRGQHGGHQAIGVHVGLGARIHEAD